METTADGTLDYQELFAGLPIPTLVLRPDVPRYTILAASRSFLALTRSRAEDLIGRGLFEVYPGRESDPLHGQVAASLARVDEGNVTDRVPIFRYDLPREAPEMGLEPRYWAMSNSALRDARSGLRYLICQIEDVTDPTLAVRRDGDQTLARLQADPQLARTHANLVQYSRELRRSYEKLAERDARLSAIFQQSPVFQGLVSPEGRVIDANDLPFDVCGFRREEELGRLAWDCGWWAGSDDTRAWMRRAFVRALAGEHVHEEFDYWWADGSRHNADMRVSPIRGPDGAVLYVHITGMDITERQQLRARLVDSEAQHRSLVSRIPGMVFRAEFAPPWKMLFCSEGTEALTGHPASYFVEGNHPWSEIVLPEDLESMSRTIGEQIAAGEPVRVEYRIRHRDGTVRWVEGRANVLEDQPGVFEGAAVDIDARKRAELALAESREHYRYTTQMVPGVILTARPDGSLDFLSDYALRFTGSKSEERGERGWMRAIHPDDVKQAYAAWRHSVATGERYDVQYRVRDSQGEYHSFQVNAECRRDEQGRILRWYGIATNIDKLLQAQAALRESERRLSATLNAAPGLSWSARADGHVDYVSEGSRAVFGVEPAALDGDGWFALIHPDHQPRVAAAWAHCLQTGDPYEVEALMQSGLGGYRWMMVRALADRDADGCVLRWHGSATEIDDLKQAQARAEEALRAKSAFLSTMSHEIRTPLNAVLGFAGLLADAELGPQQREFVNSIRSSGDHLLGVINDILDFSKLESGGLSLDFGRCDLRRTVEAALDLVASQAATKNLELLYRIDADVPACCFADQARLRQVLVNLLGNAVKFTRAGEVRVSISARPLWGDEVEFLFRVSDTGIGIPADRLERLFRDFSQVDDSVARRFGGTGLGLAISKRLVEAHGGSMRAESKLGVGSEFSFRLPARVCPTMAAERTEHEPLLSGRRVLLVDDNRAQLDVLGAQLRSWGLDVVCVQESLRALETLQDAVERDRPFELALLDQHMPELDGLELAQCLRAVAPLPVVLLSSLGMTLESARAAGAELVAVLTKPVHRALLFDVLCGVLLGRSPEGAIMPSGSQAPAAPPPLRLLLVEDNSINRRVALMLLSKIGYERVDVAVDGLEAIEAVSRRDYDVVLMDVQMPELDGLEATRRIRKDPNRTQQPQIIAMTANAMIEDREACIAAGMDDYLAKPIAAQQLTETLLNAARRLGIHAPGPSRPRPSPREEAEARAQHVTAQVLGGGGETGALMRSIDWSATPLGPVYTWPQSLRTALSIVMNQKHPMFLWWGPELIQFYNDAYRPILGMEKHPKAMGMRGRECWKEIWDVIGPDLMREFEGGGSTLADRQRLCFYRNGFLEEGYFSYGYSAIRDESGGIGGVLVAVAENTAEVLGARRDRLLLELDERLSAGGTGTRIRDRVRAVLAGGASDLPFVLVYEIEPDTALAQLRFSFGLEAGSQSAPLQLVDDTRWPVFECAHDHRTLIRDNPAHLPVLPPWPEPSRQAVLLPLGPSMVLVAGISARLPMNEAYLYFLDRLAARLRQAAAQGLARN